MCAENIFVQVEIPIRKADNGRGSTSEKKTGAEQASDTALDQYRELRARAVLKPGASNVSDKHAILVPL